MFTSIGCTERAPGAEKTELTCKRLPCVNTEQAERQLLKACKATTTLDYGCVNGIKIVELVSRIGIIGYMTILGFKKIMSLVILKTNLTGKFNQICP